MSPHSEPLVSDPTAIPFYDPQVMITMPKPLAQGYISLLSGGDPKGMENLRRNRIKRSAVEMGFLALTEGNVVEACFGISQQLATRDSPKVAATVRRIKNLLEQTADSNETICKLAVGSYLKAFEIVINGRDEIDQLNFFTRCFFLGKVAKKTQQELQEAFAMLQEAVQAAS